MNDTHPDAERVQIELIRRMPPEKRAALASCLRNRTYWMARRAIDQARPELSEADANCCSSRFIMASISARASRGVVQAAISNA